MFICVYLLEDCQHQFAENLAGEGSGCPGLVETGRQLVYISGDDIGSGYSVNGFEQLHKGDAAGFRSTGTREAGWVKTVEIYGEVDGDTGVPEPGYCFFKTGEIKLVEICMYIGEAEFIPFAASDAELMNPKRRTG